ncbi:MAG TPA: IS1595 family transposase [Nitrososphaera sp.]|jgi:transposase-like protein|nr:IS1595 family transposase [Nitrososphaera sp.]
MAASSKQFVRARISRAKFRQILKLFALDLTATQITALTGLNRNTVNRYLTLIRQTIAEHCQRESPFSGDVELDESYFGARRVRGKRGRGARGKTIVFGIYKRNGRVYTEVVPNCKKSSIQAIIRGKVDLAATIHTDGFRSYDGIVHMGYRKHYRVQHGKDEFVRGTAHINGIEGFWGMAKTRLVKFKGMSRSTFYLHLKECEWRFNHRDEDLYRLLLKITRSAIAI